MNAIYANADFQNIILTVLALVVILVILGCIYTFIRAIIMFVFSNNKEENKKKGRNSIRFMIIGVFLTVVLLFLVPVVLGWMKVPESSTYTPSNVFGRAGELVKGVFTLGNFIEKSQKNSEYRGEFYENIHSDTSLPQPISNDTYTL